MEGFCWRWPPGVFFAFSPGDVEFKTTNFWSPGRRRMDAVARNRHARNGVERQYPTRPRRFTFSRALRDVGGGRPDRDDSHDRLKPPGTRLRGFLAVREARDVSAVFGRSGFFAFLCLNPWAVIYCRKIWAPNLIVPFAIGTVAGLSAIWAERWMGAK